MRKPIIWIIAIFLLMPVVYPLPTCRNIALGTTNISLNSICVSSYGFGASVQPKQASFFICQPTGETLDSYTSSGVRDNNPFISTTNEGGGLTVLNTSSIFWGRWDINAVKQYDYSGNLISTIADNCGGCFPSLTLSTNGSQYLWRMGQTIGSVNIGKVYRYDVHLSTDDGLIFDSGIKSAKGVYVANDILFISNQTQIFEFDTAGNYICNFTTNVDTGTTIAGLAGNDSNLFVYSSSASVVKIISLDITNQTALDTTPPSITAYSLDGCANWNTDKTNACSSADAAPTVEFNTSKPSWCAIIGNYSSTLGMNYTDMGSRYNCTGGEGTYEHICTLVDEFVYETAYLYISCKDDANRQNRTSTSSALKVSVTGLDTTASDAISLGVQNSLLSGYTNYTGQQIYARNLVNTQVKGAYDKAAKKGNKTWAINWIGPSESFINMFNLTPVLYTLEFSNLTATNMTKQVELLINGTT